MRRERKSAAITAAVAVLSVAAAVAGVPAAAAAVLALPLLAAPGYVWTAVLFGGRLRGLQRVLVATGLSLAVPVLGGLVLQAAGILLHRTAWVCLFAGVTLLGDVVIFARRRPGGSAPAGPAGGVRLRVRSLLSWQLAAFAGAAVIAAGAVGLAAAGAAIQPYGGFTQLWLTPAHGKAARPVLGVSNHEGSTERYRLVVVRHGRVTTTWNLVLGSGQTWRRTIRPTGQAPMTADLYRLPDLRHPYRYVTVSAAAGT